MADIDIGKISESLNNKTDRNMRNVDTGAKADSVIDYQEPTAENGYTWYRKYLSGWVEQGGAILTTDALNVVFTLPIEMATDTYAIFGNCNIYSNSSGHFTPNSATTTSFTANCGSVDGAYGKGWWQVCGISA